MREALSLPADTPAADVESTVRRVVRHEVALCQILGATEDEIEIDDDGVVHMHRLDGGDA